MSPFRFASQSLCTAAAILTLACGDSTGPGSDNLGTYTLRSVNGQAVPTVLFEDAFYKFEILSGSMTLNAGGTCGSIMASRLTDKETNVPTTDTQSAVCTYAIAANTLTVTVDGEASSANISGGTITVTEEGLVAVFRR